MERKNVILQTIRRLKEIKEENSLTIPQIMEKVEKKGVFVSEATLKRVFSPGSEQMNFRYQDSIAPVADVLFEEYGDTSPTDDPHELRKLLRERDKEIAKLTIKIEGMEDAKKMFQERQKILENFIFQLQSEVELLKSQIEKKDAMFDRIMTSHVLNPDA